MSEFNQGKMIDAIQEQQAHWMTFAAKVMENSMKLFELNVKIAKESIEDSSDSFQHLIASRTPEDVFKLDAEKMQGQLNRMMVYAKEMNEITSGLNTELCQITQSQIHKASEKTSKFVADTKRATPSLHHQHLDFMLAALNNASKNYGQWMDARKKITEASASHSMQNKAEVHPRPAATHKKRAR